MALIKDEYTIFIVVIKSTKYFAPPWQCKGNPLLHFHGNTGHFYTSDSYIHAKNKMEIILSFPWQIWLRERVTM